jgi:deoxyribonuclease-4
MAGKGSEVGISFEQIKSIIDKIELKDKIGVCLDTCHINDAGYDLNNFEEILDQFDNIIGLNKLYCVHINDSKNERGSHKDRHENIGYGNIGFDNLISVIYNERLDGIPKILETPYISLDSDKKKSYPPYKFEIEMIKNKKFNNNLKEEVINYYK